MYIIYLQVNLRDNLMRIMSHGFCTCSLDAITTPDRLTEEMELKIRYDIGEGVGWCRWHRPGHDTCIVLLFLSQHTTTTSGMPSKVVH